MRIKSALTGNVILILAIGRQGEHLQPIEQPDTRKGSELSSGRKTAVALPPLLA